MLAARERGAVRGGHRVRRAHLARRRRRRHRRARLARRPPRRCTPRRFTAALLDAARGAWRPPALGVVEARGGARRRGPRRARSTARRSRPTPSCWRWARGPAAWRAGCCRACAASRATASRSTRATCRRTRCSWTTAPPTAARWSPRSSRGRTARSTCAAWPIRRRCRIRRRAWTVSDAACDVLARAAGRVSTALAAARDHATRQACYRPVTDDGLPLIGRVPGVARRLRGDGPRPVGHAQRARHRPRAGRADRRRRRVARPVPVRSRPPPARARLAHPAGRSPAVRQPREDDVAERGAPPPPAARTSEKRHQVEVPHAELGHLDDAARRSPPACPIRPMASQSWATISSGTKDGGLDGGLPVVRVREIGIDLLDGLRDLQRRQAEPGGAEPVAAPAQDAPVHRGRARQPPRLGRGGRRRRCAPPR